MPKRVTIVLDDYLYERLRKFQAKKIQDTSKAVSFSSIINETLKKKTK